MHCDVCLSGDTECYDEDDQFVSEMIVLCELCNVAVHQTCYGRELNDGVPKDEWYCNRCKLYPKKKI